MCTPPVSRRGAADGNPDPRKDEERNVYACFKVIRETFQIPMSGRQHDHVVLFLFFFLFRLNILSEQQMSCLSAIIFTWMTVQHELKVSSTGSELTASLSLFLCTCVCRSVSLCRFHSSTPPPPLLLSPVFFLSCVSASAEQLDAQVVGPLLFFQVLDFITNSAGGGSSVCVRWRWWVLF